MWWNKAKSSSARQVSPRAKALAAPLIMSLEPRMLFDGAVAATVVDTAHADSHTTTDATKPAAATDHAASNDSHPQSDVAATPTPTPKPPATPGQAVVFIDSRVKDSDSLLKGVAAGTQVVELDATKDGLQQIADYLDHHQGVSTVEIIAHGNTGDLWLGDSYLSADNIAQRSSVLAEIGKDMKSGGDILIYACNTAEGARGISFVDSLAQMTGRDIAASTNRTGAGGDWTLEVATGVIESHNVLSSQAMASYQYSLATLTVTNNGDSGVGSLRQALSNAVAGDLITFSTSMTVNLNSQLVITKNVTIDGDLNHDGVADVTFSGQYKTRVLSVTAGNVTLEGLVITKGLAAGTGGNGGFGATGAMAGGIFNAGILTLNNVSVTSNGASGGGGGGGVTGAFYGGAGGGGGGLGGQGGGHGGSTGPGTSTLGGQAGGGGVGGYGGGYDATHMGGRGGTLTGGAGGLGVAYYSNGGHGATATNGTISIGGGGGGAGWDKVGGAGGNAAGGIYNASTGTITIVGTSTITNNIGAGGGGGGGGGYGSNTSNGGIGGRGVGAIWNKGTLLITAANFATLSGNAAASGAGGAALGGGSTGTSPTSVATIFNDGGTLNTNYIVDTTPPTSAVVVATTSLNSGSTSLVTITFSEAVTGFTNADLSVPNGTLSAVSSSDGGITWTATLTAAGNINNASNAITLTNSGVSDLAGNAGVGTTTSNNYVIHDTLPPTASIVVANNALKIGSTSLVTITFSEAVTGFTNADLTIADGTLSAVSSSDGGITWTAILAPTASVTSATNLITLDKTGVQDLSGNAGVGSTNSNNYAIDTVRPTATIVVANSALAIGQTSLVTITFSEAVTGFTNADLTIANGTLSAVSSSDGGQTWTATLTPTASITNAASLITLSDSGVSDTAGNAGLGTTNSNSYAIDTVRPTAAIVVADGALTAGETSLVTITFSEAVTGFTNADLSVPNGALSAVSSSDGGITWTATFTPTTNVHDTTNVISLTNSGVSDLAGNAGAGTTSSGNFTIDTVRPTATIVVADNALKIGDTSLVTITFSQAVSGFTNADLAVEHGTLSAVSSGDGGITWTATFTPTNNITDSTNLITLDNSSVQNASGNAGSGSTNSNNYAIDTQRPTATIVVADNALGIGQTSLVTITFSEAVTGFNNSDLLIGNGTLSAVSSSDGGVTWTATLTPVEGVSHANNLITLTNSDVTDLAGNAGTGTSDSNAYAVDSQRPTANIVVANPTLLAGQTSLVTITFSEAVTGFTNADLSVPNGTLSAVSSSDGGITWAATFTPTAGIADTTNLITLNNSGVADLAGNAGAGTTNSGNFTIDTVRPTASIVVADSALKVGETSLVTITFNEAVSGFTNADLSVANGTLSGLSSSDGGVTWTATLTPTVAITDSTNVITLDNSGVQSTDGNAGSGTTNSNNYAIDTQRPTATIVVADNALAIGHTSLVTITFSEAVREFTNADLTVANGTLSNVSTSDGGVTWTATLTPTAAITDASNVISLDNTGVTDAAGNAGAGTTNSNTYAIDTQRPTATIVVADNALAIGHTSLVTITFSEAVSGFTNADLTIANGTLSAVSSSDGGITWTATLTPTAAITDSTNLVTLDNTGVTDAAGNAGSGHTDSNNYAIDTQRPTATIVVADNALAIGQTSLVTITFSEAVSGFDNSDLTVANGTLSAVSSSDGGVTWTATFTPRADVSNSANVITLNNAGVNDAAGNVGNGTTDSNNYAIDTQRPTATVVVADNALAIGQTSLVTITFSEAVSGFTNADLTVANGTLSNVSSSDGGVTWTATLTPAAAITDASNVISLDNTGVIDTAGNAGAGTTDSNNYAIDTQRPTATIVVADNALAIGQTSLVTITFSEAVSGFTNADLTIANGTLSAVSSSDGGITWTATLTPTAAITDASNVISLDNTGVTDAAGNAGAGATDSNNYAIDTQRPTATVVVADNALAIGQTSLVTITFSEAVSGFSNADLTVANGTLSNVSSSDGGVTWTATLTPTAAITDASNVISLDNTSVTDAAGNAGAGATDSNNYAIDTQRPTATVVVADNALAIGQTSLVTITFSEAVSGFTNADLTVANGTLSNVSSSDGGVTWTATLTPAAAITDTSNLITLDNTGVTDAAGNAGAGTTNSNNYAIDTQRPTATVVIDRPALAAGQTSLVTITFSEAVNGFDNSDLSIPNGTLSAVSSRDGGITWTATFTPATAVSDTSNVIILNTRGVTDLAGNAGSGSASSGNFAVDTVLPTATIVLSDTALKNGETSQVTITFSQAVKGFDLSDLSASNGTLSALTSSDGGVTWTATFTPNTHINDSSNLITLNNAGVQTVAGSAGTGTTDSANYVIDTVAPTVTGLVKVTNPSAPTGSTTFNLTFSEAMTGVDAGDFSVLTSGSVVGSVQSVVQIDAQTYQIVVSGISGTGSIGLSLNGAGVSDVAGNTLASNFNSDTFAVAPTNVSVGDPQFRLPPLANLIPVAAGMPAQLLASVAPPGAFASPLIAPSLFELPTLGSGVPTLGNIFINNQALAPSYIAQVFSSGDFGFVGSGGGISGSSTISGAFGRSSVPDVSPLNVFDGKQWRGSDKDAGEGVRGIFGAPTLGQQLHQLKENEQRQIHELALMLEQIGASEALA